jgi:hypothetical protein
MDASPHNHDPISLLRASNAKQAEEAGGTGTLEGREIMLSAYIQEWVAEEISNGTNPADAVNSMIYAVAFNMVAAAHNMSRVTELTPEEVFEKFEDCVFANARQMLKAKPIIVSEIKKGN